MNPNIKDLAIKSYINNLPGLLAKEYGKSETYSPEQIKKLIKFYTLGSQYERYAFAMLSERKSFDKFYQEKGGICNFDSIRSEIADEFYKGNANFVVPYSEPDSSVSKAVPNSKDKSASSLSETFKKKNNPYGAPNKRGGSSSNSLYDELGIDKKSIESRTISLLKRRIIGGHVSATLGRLIFLGVLGGIIYGLSILAESVVGDNWLKWVAGPILILTVIILAVLILLGIDFLSPGSRETDSSSKGIWNLEPKIMDFIFDTVWNVGILAVAYICIGILFLEYDLPYLIDIIVSNIPVLAIIGVVMTVFGIRDSRRS